MLAWFDKTVRLNPESLFGQIRNQCSPSNRNRCSFRPEYAIQAYLMKSLAHHYHRPCYLRLPSFLVKILLGEMGDALLLHGQNVKPSRLQEHHFSFYYAHIEDAIKSGTILFS